MVKNSEGCLCIVIFVNLFVFFIMWLIYWRSHILPQMNKNFCDCRGFGAKTAGNMMDVVPLEDDHAMNSLAFMFFNKTTSGTTDSSPTEYIFCSAVG